MISYVLHHSYPGPEHWHFLPEPQPQLTNWSPCFHSCSMFIDFIHTNTIPAHHFFTQPSNGLPPHWGTTSRAHMIWLLGASWTLPLTMFPFLNLLLYYWTSWCSLKTTNLFPPQGLCTAVLMALNTLPLDTGMTHFFKVFPKKATTQRMSPRPSVYLTICSLT